MIDNFTIFDAKLDLFLGIDIDNNGWIWSNYDNLRNTIPYIFLGENEIEEFCNAINDGNWKDLGYSEEFINLIMAGMPNVWFVKIINNKSPYRVDYSGGIKI